MNSNQFIKFWRLSKQEKTLQVEATFCLLRTVLNLELLGLARTLRAQNTRLRYRPGSGAKYLELESAVLAVNRAARAMHIGTCLSKSLALHHLLWRRGLHTLLRIGIDMNSGPTRELAAHAWLEHEGRPLDRAHTFSHFDSVFPAIDLSGLTGEGRSDTISVSTGVR